MTGGGRGVGTKNPVRNQGRDLGEGPVGTLWSTEGPGVTGRRDEKDEGCTCLLLGT